MLLPTLLMMLTSANDSILREPHQSGCPTFGASLFLRLRWDIYHYCLYSLLHRQPNDLESAFGVRREGQAGADVGLGEIGKIGQNLLMGHSASQVIQHIVEGDPQPANTGLAATFSGFNGIRL